MIRRYGTPVLCHCAGTTKAEARWIVERLQELQELGVPYQEGELDEVIVVQTKALFFLV